jgi:hypothetical protein
MKRDAVRPLSALPAKLLLGKEELLFLLFVLVQLQKTSKTSGETKRRETETRARHGFGERSGK